MVSRWILIDDATGKPEPEGYLSNKDAWKAAIELARKHNRSPYEWTAYEITFYAI